MSYTNRQSHSLPLRGRAQGDSHPTALVRLALLLAVTGSVLQVFAGPPDLSAQDGDRVRCSGLPVQENQSRLVEL